MSEVCSNNAFQNDKIPVSHLLQRAQKLLHGYFAVEQRPYRNPSVEEL